MIEEQRSNEPVSPEEDKPFQHRSRKQFLVAWVSANLFDWPVYTVRHGLNKGQVRRGGLAWLPVDSAPSEEEKFWHELQKAGKLNGVIYDVGSFVGLLAMFFAKTAKKVIAFEPNPPSLRRLRDNIALNKLDERVQCVAVALDSRSGTSTMVSDPLFAGFASLSAAGSGAPGESVTLKTLDEMVREGQIDPPTFIKLDVEGAEGRVLRGALWTLRTHRPEVFVELHGHTMRLKRENARDVYSVLADAGFAKFLHVESGKYVTATDVAEVAAEGHLYCTW